MAEKKNGGDVFTLDMAAIKSEKEEDQKAHVMTVYHNGIERKYNCNCLLGINHSSARTEAEDLEGKGVKYCYVHKCARYECANLLRNGQMTPTEYKKCRTKPPPELTPENVEIKLEQQEQDNGNDEAEDRSG